jgi:hypothetical protein
MERCHLRSPTPVPAGAGSRARDAVSPVRCGVLLKGPIPVGVAAICPISSRETAKVQTETRHVVSAGALVFDGGAASRDVEPLQLDNNLIEVHPTQRCHPPSSNVRCVGVFQEGSGGQWGRDQQPHCWSELVACYGEYHKDDSRSWMRNCGSRYNPVLESAFVSWPRQSFASVLAVPRRRRNRGTDRHLLCKI